jgi:hypothetical protein
MDEATLPSSHSLSNEQLVLIGRIVVDWALLELAIDMAFWGLLGMSQNKARAVTSYISFGTRLDLTKDLLARYISQTVADEFSPIVGRIKELSRDRNAVVHSNWHSTGLGQDLSFAVIQRRGDFLATARPMNLSELDRIWQLIVQTTIDAADFFGKHNVPIAPPDSSPESRS